MDLKEFSTKHRLRIQRDGCGDLIVPGRFTAKDMPKRPEYSSHVYDGFADGRLGVCLMFGTARKWGNVRRALEAVGCQLKQNSDSEGCFIFDPANASQVAAVIKLAGLKVRRTASPAQLAVLEAARTLRKAA